MIPIASPDLKQIALLMETIRNSDTTPQIKKSVNMIDSLLVKALSSTHPVLHVKLEDMVRTFQELATQYQFPELQTLADKLEQVVLSAISSDEQKKKLLKKSQKTTPELSKPAP